MKKLAYILIFGLVLTAKLHAMDEADVGCPAKSQYEAGQEIRKGQQGQTVQEQPRIKIQTSDDQEYEIPKNIAEKSLTIKNITEGLDEDEDTPIPLPNINKDLWDKVYPLMDKANKGNIGNLKYALTKAKLSNEDLIDVIPPINFLEIVMIDSNGDEVNLVDLAIKELLKRIDNKSLTINKYSEQLENYPDDLQKEIVKDLINRSGLGTYKLLQTLRGHIRAIYSVAWSPDGSKLASGSGDGTIKIWDTQSGKLLQRLNKYTGWFFNFGEGHTDFVYSVAWSPDGSTLASGSADKTIKIWDAEAGKLLQTLEGHTGSVTSVAWSPDGRKLASGSADKTIMIWNANSGELLQTLEGHGDWVYSVAWSPDGSTLASGSDDKTIKIWDTQFGKLLQTLEGHGDWVYSVAWSPDGSTIASGSLDKTVKIWDVESGELLRTLEGHTGWVYSVAWSPDGSTIASGSQDKTIKIWDMQSGEVLQTLRGHISAIYSVAWSPDSSKLASGSFDGIIEIWRSPLPQQILDMIVNLPLIQAYAVIKALEDQKLRDLIILLEEEQLVVLFKAFGGQELTDAELSILESLPSDLRYFVEAQAGVKLLD